MVFFEISKKIFSSGLSTRIDGCLIIASALDIEMLKKKSIYTYPYKKLHFLFNGVTCV